MKNERDVLLIAYIIDAISKLTDLVKEPDAKQRFVQEWIFHDAILHRLQTMAESCQRLSDPLKSTLPTVPWKEISGLRNILVHDYLGDIDLETIWHILTHELPILRNTMDNISTK